MRKRPEAQSLPRVLPGREFVDEWVAIYGRRAADHDKDLELLWKRLARKGIADECVFYHVPRPGVVYA